MDAQVEWTPHEGALWRTCEVLAALHRDEPLAAQPVAFAPHLGGGGETILVSGTYERMWFGALGDGSYTSSHFIAGGFGAGGMALAAATFAGSAAHNQHKRAQAAADTVPRWTPADAGTLHVSADGWYLQTGPRLLAFPFSCVLQADMVAPGAVQISCEMDGGGQDAYLISSMWAELLFARWATTRCPGHPRLTNLAWLPQPFVDRVVAAGVWDSSPIAALVSGA